MWGARWAGRCGLVLWAWVLLSVAGCGFRPIYGDVAGDGGSAQDRLAEINVLLIPERTGQLLRQGLQERFERAGSGMPRRYDLAVQYGISGDQLGFQRDNNITRVRLTGQASWVLYAQDAQRSTVASGRVREVDAYNVISQQYFASDLSNTAVQRRISEAVAEQITTQIASHFSRTGGR